MDEVSGSPGDSELVHQIQASNWNEPGRSEAVSALYDRHHDRIFRYLYARVNNRQQAEDFTSEVFTRMVAALPLYQDRNLPFQAWLYRIARNLLIDEYHRRHTPQWVMLTETLNMPADDHDPLTVIEDQLTMEEVHRALEQIDSQQRDVIVMRFLIGLPIKEVALILNKSESNIRAMQFRGLKNLRTILEPVRGISYASA